MAPLQLLNTFVVFFFVAAAIAEHHHSNLVGSDQEDEREQFAYCQQRIKDYGETHCEQVFPSDHKGDMESADFCERVLNYYHCMNGVACKVCDEEQIKKWAHYFEKNALTRSLTMRCAHSGSDDPSDEHELVTEDCDVVEQRMANVSIPSEGRPAAFILTGLLVGGALLMLLIGAAVWFFFINKQKPSKGSQQGKEGSKSGHSKASSATTSASGGVIATSSKTLAQPAPGKA